MAINKVIYNSEVLIDVTDCDATEADVAAGKKPFAGKSFETTYVAYEDIMKAQLDLLKTCIRRREMSFVQKLIAQNAIYMI